LAGLVEQAVGGVLEMGLRTADIAEDGKAVSCEEMGEAVVNQLKKLL
jgi:isocitrate/isopropylmalate dehydrogenase